MKNFVLISFIRIVLFLSAIIVLLFIIKFEFWGSGEGWLMFSFIHWMGWTILVISRMFTSTVTEGSRHVTFLYLSTLVD